MRIDQLMSNHPSEEITRTLAAIAQPRRPSSAMGPA
jgi:hypothetical protein